VLFCFLGSLALYATTAAPSVATIFDDSLEFQVVLPTLAIAHPPGYPLYTLVGRLFISLVPWRDPAGRANLFSAVSAATAVGVLYAVGRRLTGRRIVALAVTAVFALSPTWWSQATIAEVYALHGLLVAAFIYMMLRGLDGAEAWLCAAALVAGLGLAHHRMILLLLPAAAAGLLLAWLCGQRDLRISLRQPRLWLRLVLLGVAPLLLYLYLPWRGQFVGSLDGTFAPTAQVLWEWVTARPYSVFLTANPFGVSRDARFFVSLFLDQLGVVLVGLAVLGVATAWRGSLPRYLFLLLATASQVAFGLAYKVEDVAVFFLPAFMLAVLWAGLGMTFVVERAGHGSDRLSAQRVVGSMLAALVLAQPVYSAVRDFPQRDRSDDWVVYDLGQDMLDHVAPRGQVIGLLGETTLLRYFRDVLGQRRDVSLVAADAESARLAAVEAGLASGIPVYLTRDLPGIAGRYSLDAVGPLIAVSPKATPGPPPAGQEIGAGLALVAARVEMRQLHSGQAVRIRATWTALSPPGEALKVSARLVDAAGRVLAADDRVPVHFAYPTTAWVVGESVEDVYDLPLPRNMPVTEIRPLLILYRAADASEIGRIELPTMPLAGPAGQASWP